MATREFEGTLFGQTVRFRYSQRWIAYAIFILRIVMGWIFLQAGLEKLLAPEGWTAAGYLANAVPPGNPLAGVWEMLAGQAWVDALNIWGQILIGIALITGTAVRFSAFWGALMMILYWLTALQGGLLQGLPLEHGWVVDDHIVYAALLFGLGAFGAGRILGVDRWLENTQLVENNEWLKAFLG